MTPPPPDIEIPDEDPAPLSRPRALGVLWLLIGGAVVSALIAILSPWVSQ